MDEVAIIDHIEQVNDVADLYLRGFNEMEIGRQLGIPKARVSGFLKEWKASAANNEAVRLRAREALAGADQHYGHIIKQTYEVIDDLSGGALTTQEQTVKLNALKLLSDLEQKRMDMLHKAGLLENKELADQLLENERKQELLMKILLEVSATCPVCKPKMLQRLAEVNDSQEAVVIYNA